MLVANVLKSNKLKVTKARLAIGRTLEHARKPLKIESIYSLLPHPKPDLVTIYRILGTFEKAGLVRQVDLRHGHTHYEWGHSHHITCESCGTIFLIEEKSIEKTLHSITEKYKKEITVTDHAIEFFGICKKCR